MLSEFLESEEFYNAMQGYRCAPMVDQREVVAHFENVKRLIRKHQDKDGQVSLRDEFAGKYMNAICATSFFTDGNLMDHDVAHHAYAMADAMLKAREESK